MKVYVSDSKANEHINIIASLVEKRLSDLDISNELTRLGHKNLASPYGSWSESDIKNIRETFKLEGSDSAAEINKNYPAIAKKKIKNNSSKEVAIVLIVSIIGIWYLAKRDSGNESIKSQSTATSVSQGAQAAPDSGINSNEAKELAALMINLNKHLCAEVIEIRPLKVNKNVHEVTCIEYRGGTGRKTYLIDVEKGVAWVP